MFRGIPMRKPFNPIEAAMLKALTEALFHGSEMVITSDQVVDNLQRQFALFHGNKPREIALPMIPAGSPNSASLAGATGLRVSVLRSCCIAA